MSGAEEIRVEVVRTKADFFWGVLFNAIQGPWWLANLALAPLLVAVVAFVAAPDVSLETSASIAAIGFGAAFIGIALIRALAVYLAARRSWMAPDALGPVSYVFGPESMKVSNKTGSSELKWAVWKGAFETDALLVVQHPFGLIHILPKRDIAEDAMEELRALLRARIAGRVRLRGAEGGAA